MFRPPAVMLMALLCLHATPGAQAPSAAPGAVDPRLFGEDALDFNPHRVVTEGSPWGLAFGGGMHACLGRPLVTGIASGEDVTDGTMLIMMRTLLAVGMQLDREHPPVPDSGTFYEAYSSLPVVLTELA